MSEREYILERTYVIPLRKAYYVPRGKRVNKAIRIIKNFVKRHLHVNDVKIGTKLNCLLWSRNREKPPRKIKVVVRKIDEDTAEVELVSE